MLSGAKDNPQSEQRESEQRESEQRESEQRDYTTTKATAVEDEKPQV